MKKPARTGKQGARQAAPAKAEPGPELAGLLRQTRPQLHEAATALGIRGATKLPKEDLARLVLEARRRGEAGAAKAAKAAPAVRDRRRRSSLRPRPDPLRR